MQLKGQLTIHVIDGVTGKLKGVHEQRNLITDLTYAALVDYLVFVPAPFAGLSIALSSSTATPASQVPSVSGIFSVASIVGRTFTPATATAAPHFTIQGRVASVGFSRTFQTVALTNFSPNNNYATPVTDNNVRAYLKLEAPVTQGELEILELYYRVTYEKPLPGSGFLQGNSFIDEMSRGGEQNTSRYTTLSYLQPSFAATPNADLCLHLYHPTAGNSTTYLTHHWLKEHSNTYLKMKNTRTLTLDEMTGRIFNLAIFGSNQDSGYMVQATLPPGSSPKQTLWGHGATAFHPFFDSNTTPTGGGMPTFSGDWSNNYPTMYQVDIVASGELGAATYRLKKKSFLGFQGNSWVQSVVPNVWRHPSLPAYPNSHGYQSSSNNNRRFSDRQLLQVDNTGISIVDVYTGVHKSWDATTDATLIDSTLPVTAARYAEAVGDIVYVGCRNTGLWRVDTVATNYQVSRLVDVPCYGLAKLDSGEIIGLFEGGMRSSINWSQTLTVTLPALSANWSLASYISIDPASSDAQTAIVLNVPLNDKTIHWWSKSNPVVNTSNSLTINGISGNQLQQSPTSIGGKSGRWVLVGTYIYTLGFNSPTVSYKGVLSGIGSVVFAPNSTAFYCRNTEQSGQRPGWRLFNPDDTETIISEEHSPLNNGQAILLGNGILSLGNWLTVPDTRWLTYGWNGSTWALGQTGTKATHSSSDSALDGLSISFTGGTGADFVAGEFYTQPYCHGVLKDNATTMTYSFTLYAKPTHENTAFPANPSALSVPAVSPYQVYFPAKLYDPKFRQIEVSDLNLLDIKLNGTSIPKSLIFTNGANPAPGGVTVDPLAGIMVFHSTDAGKVISGYYAYQEL